MDLNKKAEELKEVIQSSFRNEFKGKEKVGIMFSGGVDSSLIALLASRELEDLKLYSAGLKGSKDMKSARKVSEELSIKLKTNTLRKKDIEPYIKRSIEILDNFDVINIELGVPIIICCELASKDNRKYLAIGQGSEELFGGYKRHEEVMKEGKNLNKVLKKEVDEIWDTEVERDEKVIESFGMKGIYPFLNEELVEHALKIPAEMKITEKYKKHVLRLAAKKLGVPEKSWRRPKKAMQYGSGIHKIIEKLPKEKGIDKKVSQEQGFYGPIQKYFYQLWTEVKGEKPDLEFQK